MGCWALWRGADNGNRRGVDGSHSTRLSGFVLVGGLFAGWGLCLRNTGIIPISRLLDLSLRGARGQFCAWGLGDASLHNCSCRWS